MKHMRLRAVAMLKGYDLKGRRKGAQKKGSKEIHESIFRMRRSASCSEQYFDRPLTILLLRVLIRNESRVIMVCNRA